MIEKERKDARETCEVVAVGEYLSRSADTRQTSLYLSPWPALNTQLPVG